MLLELVVSKGKNAGQTGHFADQRVPSPANDAEGLIAPDEGPVVEVINPGGAAGVVLLCEHAGNLVPRSLANLGLAPSVLSAHIAWDPGAAPVARLMAKALDAPLVLQRFSRLVYDCNRPPDAKSAMPDKSELFDIPGNVDLCEADRQRRIEAIYRPFRAQVAALLDDRIGRGQTTAIVTIHSFTPIYFGHQRAVELGILHDEDHRLADAMFAALAKGTDGSDCGNLDVRRNEPYGPNDGVTHTLKVDAIIRGLPNAMIEIRNDLIATEVAQAAMAARLANLVRDGLRRLPAFAAGPDCGIAG